jgi:hypothetical protein
VQQISQTTNAAGVAIGLDWCSSHTATSPVRDASARTAHTTVTHWPVANNTQAMAALGVGAPDNGTGGPSPPPQSRATGRTERVLAVLYGCPAFTFYGRQYTAYTTHTQCGYPVWAGVSEIILSEYSV